MGYVHYYLSTAYELLCGAMKQDPAGTLAVESVIQQSRVRRAVMVGCGRGYLLLSDVLSTGVEVIFRVK